MNLAKGIKGVNGFTKIFEAYGSNEGRVYFQNKDEKIELLDKCHKKKQVKVIEILRKMFYSYNYNFT